MISPPPPTPSMQSGEFTTLDDQGNEPVLQDMYSSLATTG